MPNRELNREPGRRVMAAADGANSSFAARAHLGRSARDHSPRSGHGGWSAAPDRADPVGLLEEQALSRVPELVPIRYARMSISPLTFYRGAATIMAADLATTPTSGITVQLCGDAHLSNFGLFGSPERTLVFDINDFDETFPGPWEWDVKRLVASFEIAGRVLGFTDHERHTASRAVTRGYRERMRASAESKVLTAWYDRLSAEQLNAWVREEQEAQRLTKKHVARTEKALASATARDSVRALSKLAEIVNGRLAIRADPPLIVPLSQIEGPPRTRAQDEATVRRLLEGYRSTLLHENHPIAEFEFLDMARKVVGVGSVGTRAWIVLLRGRDNADPLFLQAKQAEASVVEKYLSPGHYSDQGERVVRGQRLMQASSDIFLGWQQVEGFDGIVRDYYIRQLQDWKGSVNVDEMGPDVARLYARICGETLARAHARSGDRIAIAAYLGSGDQFDEALEHFGQAYADQNEQDYAAFRSAIDLGRLSAALPA